MHGAQLPPIEPGKHREQLEERERVGADGVVHAERVVALRLRDQPRPALSRPAVRAHRVPLHRARGGLTQCKPGQAVGRIVHLQWLERREPTAHDGRERQQRQVDHVECGAALPNHEVLLRVEHANRKDRDRQHRHSRERVVTHGLPARVWDLPRTLRLDGLSARLDPVAESKLFARARRCHRRPVVHRHHSVRAAAYRASERGEVEKDRVGATQAERAELVVPAVLVVLTCTQAHAGKAHTASAMPGVRKY
mmetsp:Transcript_2489/g.6503  ORF Transcript_2489/g.6503 Transcript_2489/m.6503 type:complete len:252 (+) Transcript_2489:1068-1823(+)